MRKPLIRVALAAGALLATGLAASTAGAASAAPATQHGRHAVRVCTASGHADVASCFAKVIVNAKGRVPSSSTPPASGMTPTDLRTAYNLPSSITGHPTVAIVDAYGYPNLESDLATYRSYFGLPACTTSNGCLKIMDQTGGTSLPRFDTNWAGEQALDVDAVSAICPDCHIVMVQAKTASFANLGTAVNTAAAQPGVVAVSNSYGGGDAADSSYGKYYKHAGIAITASTGDNGYQGGSYPASSSYVVAVGGTSLYRSSGYPESAWSGAGSGCSTYNPVFSAQSGVNTGCGSYRAMADVSAAADPNNGGMAVYFPTSKTKSTWAQVGGTSESSPIIASVYALAGTSYTGYANALPYSHTSSLNDVTTGSNATTCSPSQLCTSGSGWDGPTGLGTPNGTGAF
ncbi:MAG TPA: S53 family peptidase [Marmoricola sp.]|nr:S53 family peptidase [Marmoricola sp.]